MRGLRNLVIGKFWCWFRNFGELFVRFGLDGEAGLIIIKGQTSPKCGLIQEHLKLKDLKT